MNRRLAVWVAGGLFALGLVLLAWGFWAARRVPPFYAAAVSVPVDSQREASDRLLVSAAALASHVQKEGRWQAIFTTDEINGWLATELNQTFPGLLPDYVVDPRVTVGPEGILFGCRYLNGNVETVVSLKADLVVNEANVLKVRLSHARAGAFPLPLGNVLGGVTRAATDAKIQLSWLQADGDPVAVIRLHPANDHVFYRLEKLRLGENEVFVAGYTVPRESDGSPVIESHDKPLAVVPSDVKVNRQR
jgi:hypothetical protein